MPITAPRNVAARREAVAVAASPMTISGAGTMAARPGALYSMYVPSGTPSRSYSYVPSAPAIYATSSPPFAAVHRHHFAPQRVYEIRSSQPSPSTAIPVAYDLRTPMGSAMAIQAQPSINLLRPPAAAATQPREAGSTEASMPPSRSTNSGRRALRGTPMSAPRSLISPVVVMPGTTLPHSVAASRAALNSMAVSQQSAPAVRRRNTTRTGTARAPRQQPQNGVHNQDFITLGVPSPESCMSPAAPNSRKRPACTLDKKRSAKVNVKKEPIENAAAGFKDDGSDIDNKDDQCCICLDEPSLTNVASVNGCAHLFCFGCIEKWAERENTCPLCKTRFTKIDRVHKPPPNKRRKKGDPPRGKNTKKVKNRDQRADMNSGNPLQGMFATMEANGTMPPSISQLIFSGLNGGLMTISTSTANSFDNNSAQRHTGYAANRSNNTVLPLHSYPIEGVARRVNIPETADPTPSYASSRQRVEQMLVRPEAYFPNRQSRVRRAIVSIGGSSFSAALEEDLDVDSDPEFFMQHLHNLNRYPGSGNADNGGLIDFSASARSYASNSHVMDAGDSPTNALEIEDSDEEDVVEVLAT